MRKIIIAFMGIALVLGCTIRTEHKIEAHVTVDIRHIEKQADDALDYIEGKTDKAPVESGASLIDPLIKMFSPMQKAYAAELKESSNIATQLLKKMRDRHPKIEALKKDGCLGETNRGYVELRPCEKLEDAEAKNAAQKLVSEENNDRKAYYKEIVALNEDSGVTMSQIEQVYASKRLERAKAGEIFQLPAAGQAFDEFKESPQAKALGDDAKPGAWVTIK